MNPLSINEIKSCFWMRHVSCITYIFYHNLSFISDFMWQWFHFISEDMWRICISPYPTYTLPKQSVSYFHYSYNFHTYWYLFTSTINSYYTIHIGNAYTLIYTRISLNTNMYVYTHIYQLANSFAYIFMLIILHLYIQTYILAFT